MAVKVRPSSCSRVGEAVKPWPWTRGLRGVPRRRGRRAVAVEVRPSICSRVGVAVDCKAVEPWSSNRGAMGVDGEVVAVLVVVDLVDVFPLTKCLNIGVGIGVGAVVAQDGGVSHSQRSSSPAVSDVVSYSSKLGRGGCSRDEAKA